MDAWPRLALSWFAGTYTCSTSVLSARTPPAQSLIRVPRGIGADADASQGFPRRVGRLLAADVRHLDLAECARVFGANLGVTVGATYPYGPDRLLEIVRRAGA